MSLVEHIQIKIHPDMGSLQDERDVAKAAQVVAQGGIIGCYNGGVCALWGDGRNPNFTSKMLSIKGADRQPLFGLTLPASKFIDLIDIENIPTKYQSLFGVPENLALLGSFAFVRAPAKKEMLEALEVPGCFISKDEITDKLIVQNWSPEGSPPAEGFIHALGYHGVDLPGITSMNKTKTPEIVSKRKGKKFAREEENINYFLTDEMSHGGIKGSYTILGVGIGEDHESISLVRDGSIPGVVLERMLGTDIVTNSATIPPKFSQRHFSDRATEGSSAWERRASLLKYVRDAHLKRIL